MDIKVLGLKSVAVSFAVLLALLAASCGGGSKDVEISVKVENRQLVPEQISVKENDKVTLMIQTDEPGEFRVADYNVKADVEPGKITNLNFTAFPKKSSWGSSQRAGVHRIIFHAKTEIDEEQIGSLRIAD